MSKIEDLKALLARVGEAKGPDRDLDWSIWFFTAEESSDHGTDGWPRYTSSLDDCLRLSEALLPGWLEALYPNAVDWGSGAVLVAPDRSQRSHAKASTMPLALLTAILDVLIAQEENA